MTKHDQNQENKDGLDKPEILDSEHGEAMPEIKTPDTPEAEPVNWEQKTAELEAKLAVLNDQYLRKAADFENFRKRMNREKQEISEYANQNLLLDLLPVLDDFERAIKSAETSKDFASFYEGITMIEKRFFSELENKWGLKRFDSEGQPFDPNRHEALQMEKAAGISEALVKEDYLKGYLLKERVIRFAKVKVLMPAEEEVEKDKELGTGSADN
jgi:molecular chaperone GrpE